MKAAVVTENGVQYKDAPKPSPKPNEILIKVRAASLNRADLVYAICHILGVRPAQAQGAPAAAAATGS